MKKKLILLFLIVMVVAAQSAYSQNNNVEYKVTRDDPNDICNFWMFLDPLQMDAPLQNINGLSINTGITGLGTGPKRYGFDYTFRYGGLTLYRIANATAGRAMQIEAGGMYLLKDNTGIKSNTKMVLSITSGTNNNGQEVETTKFILIPAKHRVMVHARVGLYLKKNPFVREMDEAGTDIEGDLTCIGFYIGISHMGISNVFINTNTDGQAMRSGIIRFTADLIVCPVRMLRPFGGGQAIDANGVVRSPVGFRIGIYAFPCEDRKNKKRKAFAVGADMGFRPGDGLYCTGSFMIPLARRKSTALGYKRVEGTNDKGQVIEKE